MMPAPEPHAITRLRERYGVEITRSQLQWLAMLMGEPITRRHDPLFRFIGRQSGGIEVWLTDLERYAGRPMWAKAVYDTRSRTIVTFYPRETVGRVPPLARTTTRHARFPVETPA